MSKPIYSVQQVARKWNLSEAVLQEAINSGLLQTSYRPKWGITDQDVRVWLFNIGKISADDLKQALEGGTSEGRDV